VPKIVVNEKVDFVGAVSEDLFLQYMLQGVQ
jgi:hypothetical protein